MYLIKFAHIFLTPFWYIFSVLIVRLPYPVWWMIFTMYIVCLTLCKSVINLQYINFDTDVPYINNITCKSNTNMTLLGHIKSSVILILLKTWILLIHRSDRLSVIFSMLNIIGIPSCHLCEIIIWHLNLLNNIYTPFWPSVCHFKYVEYYVYTVLIRLSVILINCWPFTHIPFWPSVWILFIHRSDRLSVINYVVYYLYTVLTVCLSY